MEYIPAIAVFFCGKLIGLIIFPSLTFIIGPKEFSPWDPWSILKGNLERLVLFTALLHDYPQMLIAFGAMKLGTRLHDEKKMEISNTYFLVGNLLSIFMAILMTVITRRLQTL